MSERAPQGPRPEQLHSAEHVEHTPQHEFKANKHQQRETVDPRKAAKEIENLRSEVTQEAVSGKDVIVDTNSEQNGSKLAQPLINRELKQHMLDRTLTRVRKKLPATSRPLSKVVHTKPVEVLSAVGERTVARPVGLLGGGIGALIGSSFTLYMARHYGYRYNFGVFLLSFGAGYLLATLFELVFKLFGRAKHGKRI